MNCDCVNFTSYMNSSVKRVKNKDLCRNIARYVPREIIFMLDRDCIMSGSALYKIIKLIDQPNLQQVQQVQPVSCIDADIIRRCGDFGPYLESLKTVLNSVKGKLVDAYADIYNLLWESDNILAYDLYVTDMHAKKSILENKKYRTVHGIIRQTPYRFCTLTKTNKKQTIRVNLIAIDDSFSNGYQIFNVIDENELSCFKLGYDGKYLYFNTRGTHDSQTSLQDLTHKRIYYNNDVTQPIHKITEYRRLNTFKMLMKAIIIDDFTFMSNDECAKELYSRFIFTNYRVICNAIKPAGCAEADLAVKLIREEYFKMFNVQKLLKFTKENENCNDYDIPVAATGSMYYVQYNEILRHWYIAGLTTLEGVPFIPEHTCAAIHFTTRIRDILPYVDTMRPFNQLGKNYSYLIWSSIIVRITSLLYDNYVENSKISVINDITDFIDIIDNNTKRRIIHNIRTNLCVDIETITPAEMLTFYFLAKVIGYFDGIQSNKRTRRTTGVKFNYINILTSFPNEEPHCSFDKFTDKIYNNRSVVKFQHIIRTLENMEECSDLTLTRTPILTDGSSIRLIINYFSFNFDMYTHLKNIYDFLHKTFDHDINIVLCNVIGDPFWVSMDVVDAFPSNEIVVAEMPMYYLISAYLEYFDYISTT